MSEHSIKPKLLAGQTCVGSWLSLGSASAAEVMARAGFDWLCIDLEHSGISISDAEAIIRTVDLAGVSPLVRLTNNDPNLIKRVLDLGAHGIIIPQVNSVSEARAAVEAAYYPPRGKRGVGLYRAQGYGHRFAEYRDWMEKVGPLVIPQIENILGVREIEGILSVSGVDGYLVGPYDLSASLGVPGNWNEPKVKDALARIDEVGVKSGKIPGFHLVEPDWEEATRLLAKGVRLLAVGTDFRILDSKSREVLSKLSKSRGK